MAIAIRRALILASFGVLFAWGNLFAAIAYVQSRSVDCGNVTSCNLAFTGNNTAGSLIIVAVRIGATGRTVTVTDSQNNTYTQRINQVQGADHEVFVIDALKISSGANTVTVSSSGAAAIIRFAIHEYRGLAPFSAYDKSNSAQSGASGTALNSGNVTTTKANELLFGVGTTPNPATFSAGTSYTIREHVGVGGDKIATEDQIVSSTGAYSATETLSAADNWACAIVTYSDTTIGSTTLNYFRRRLD
jgi:hypothetical protein